MVSDLPIRVAAEGGGDCCRLLVVAVQLSMMTGVTCLWPSMLESREWDTDYCQIGCTDGWSCDAPRSSMTSVPSANLTPSTTLPSWRKLRTQPFGREHR